MKTIENGASHNRYENRFCCAGASAPIDNLKNNKQIYIMRKIVAIMMILLLFMPISFSQRQPAGIGGYVYYNGQPVANAHVTVTNLNTNESVNTTTNSNGLYAASLYAETGDLIKATATYNGDTASKTIVANLSNVTQWINISIVSETPTQPSELSADFTWQPQIPKVGDTVQFIDLSVGNIQSYYWDFGDGFYSNERNPTHVYTEAGYYYVTLTITGISNTDSKTKQIYASNISPPPENGTIVIPPSPPPIYPENPYTIPEMYALIGLKEQKPLYSNIKIAVIDTGVTNRIFAGTNYSIDLNNVVPYSISKYPQYDENGHGTFVNAEVYYAVSKWQLGTQYSIRVMSKDGECTVDDLKEAFRIAENLGCDVISLSLGGAGSVGDALDMLVRDAAKRGIVVVAAAGNYGPELYTITTPALSPYAIAVGAENPMHTINNTYDDMVTEWSSRGPVVGVKEAKPDIVAGGESIIGPYLNEDKVLSGTSMATPFVAGGVAYMLANNKNLLGILDKLWFWDKSINQKLVEKSLEKSCRKIIGDKNAQGNGLPYIPKATRILHHEIVWHIILAIIIYIIIVAIVIISIYALKRKSYKEKSD